MHELRAAWRIFSLWEVVFGQKLGVKKRLKTGVSGVKYDANGKRVRVDDPKLMCLDGSTVPFWQSKLAYKSLGIMRSLDGKNNEAFAKIDKTTRQSVARLRLLKYVSGQEFCELGDVLLGGYGHFALQTTHLPWDKAEKMEGAFRRAYCLKFGLPLSTAAARLYAPRGQNRKPLRNHVWSIGLASLYATVFECISEPIDSQQRRAVRSALACSLARWGCRQNPTSFSWVHLRQVLEEQLQRGEVKFLGDAWMLAALLVDDHAGSKGLTDPNADGTSRLIVLEDMATDDPLHQSRPHFRPCRSSMVFQTGRDGLGLEPQAGLLEHGLVCVGNFCTDVRGGGYRWLDSFAEAVVKWGLPDEFQLRLQWDHTMCALRKRTSPTSQERPLKLSDGWEVEPDADERAAALRSTDAAYAECLRRAVDERDAGLRGEVWEEQVESWVESIRRGLGVTARSCGSGVERRTGVVDAAAVAAGPRLVFDDGRADVRVVGGAKRWGARGDVGKDGWVNGWQAVRDAAVEGIELDGQGNVVYVNGTKVSVEEAARRSPAVELAVRARARLGDDGLDVRHVQSDVKVHGVRGINIGNFGRALHRMNTAVARTGAKRAYTIDGTRKRVDVKLPSGKIQSTLVSAYAAVENTGRTLRGALVEGDNYLAEMAAQMHVARETAVHRRVVVLTDATSPVEAALHFARLCWRKQQRAYMRRWIDSWWQVLDSFDIIYIVWGRSHTLEPINDLADAEADASAELVGTGELAEDTPELEAPRYASMDVKGLVKGARGWVSELLREEVEERLYARSESSIRYYPSDIDVGILPRRLAALAEAVAVGRCQVGDPRRYSSERAKEMVREAGCPFGCGCGFTWVDVQLYCKGEPLVEARRTWELCVECASEALLHAGAGHQELGRLGARLESNRFGYELAGGRVECRTEEAKELAASVAGAIRSTGSTKADREPHARNMLRRMVCAGLAVQEAGKAATARLEKDIEEEVRKLGIARKFSRKWRKAVVRGGAERRECLQRVWESGVVQWRGRGCVTEAWFRARKVRAPTLCAALQSWQEARCWWLWRASVARSGGRVGLAEARVSEAIRAGVMWRLGGGRRVCRARAAAEYRAGRRANAWQHWAVEKLLGVRIPERRRGRQLMVTVRWVGDWAPDWADDEMPISQLVSQELKREARRMEAAQLAQRMVARAPKRQPTRVQPRREADGREVRPRQVVGVRGLPLDAMDVTIPLVEATRVWLPLGTIAEENAPT